MDAKTLGDVVASKNVSLDGLEPTKLLVAGFNTGGCGGDDDDHHHHAANALPILFDSLVASPKLHVAGGGGDESAYLKVVRDYVDELIDNCCELIANDNNNNQDGAEDSSVHDCQLSSDVDAKPTASNKNKRKKRNNKKKPATSTTIALNNSNNATDSKVCITNGHADKQQIDRSSNELNVVTTNGPIDNNNKENEATPGKKKIETKSVPAAAAASLSNGSAKNRNNKCTEVKETISKISSEAATSEVVVPVPKKLSQTHLSKRNNDDDDDNLVGEQSSEQLMDETRAKTNGMLLVNGKQHTTTATSMVNGSAATAGEALCKICNKNVYHMEQIKAVKTVFHKSCFRCKECNKQLNVDSYSSHEGIIYCNAHFKQLFQPKAVFDAEPEPQSDTKQEIEFENLNLDLSNIRNRFEKGCTSDNNNNRDTCQTKKRTPDKTITRSESIHKIMQKYQSRVAGDKSLHSSDDEEDTSTNTTPEPSSAGPTNNNNNNDEKVAFNGMSALKSQWESGQLSNTRSESDAVKSELAELRSKNKSAEPLKQVYERAVQEAKSSENLNRSDSIVTLDKPVKAVAIKEKFEKGTVETETEVDCSERARREREEEISRLSSSETITKEARNKFKQIEANMDNKETPVANGPQGKIDDVSINPDEMQQRFKYFENLKDSQTVKEPVKDEAEDIPKGDTTKKMLSKFKALEAGQVENGGDKVDAAPRTPKRITPPKEVGKVYESEPIADPNIVKSSYKSDEVIAVEPEKAKNLRAKFENWQTEIEREGRKNQDEDEYVPHIDTTKNLRAKFESIKDEQKPVDKPRPKINRFVEPAQTETCYVCAAKLYPMEKMEFSGIKLHKNCFRCNKCHTTLRLDNFTVRAEKLFCIPHFKQLFMERGNYDEGFGLEQHKDKWSGKGAALTPKRINGMLQSNHGAEQNDAVVAATKFGQEETEANGTNGDAESDQLESLDENYPNNNNEESSNKEHVSNAPLIEA